MSNKVLISSVLILIVISVFSFWYFYSKQNQAIAPQNAEQAQQQALINELNNIKQDPSTAKTPQQVSKELNVVKPPKSAPTPADVLNSLNSVQQ